MNSRSATIRRYGKTLSALVLSLTLSGGIIATSSVFAASDDTAATTTQSTGKESKEDKGMFGKRGGGLSHGAHGFHFGAIEQKIADYLNLSLADLREKQKTQTLAEIAASHHISRDKLKAQLVAWIEAWRDENQPTAHVVEPDKMKVSANKQPDWDSSAIADKILDSDLGKGGHERGFGKVSASAAIAAVLGVTEDELKTTLQSSQSIADIAASKGVAIDMVEQAIATALKSKLDKALSDGLITQEQYDKQAGQLYVIAEKMVNDKAKRLSPSS